jgi:drug/metabolite transporter (DMT)-like permease
MTVILATILLRERLRRAQTIGVVVAFAGVAVVAGMS